MQTHIKPKYYGSLKELYDDQNNAFKAEMRRFWHDMGFRGGSISRKINEGDDTRPICYLNPLYEVFNIAYDKKTQCYFFDHTDAKDELFGLS